MAIDAQTAIGKLAGVQTEAELRALIADVSVRTDPGCPWQNGRIERLFGTLKQKLDQWNVPGIEQLNRDLDLFCHWYNGIRPHQNLDGRTPAEVWRGVDSYAKPPVREHWFEAWGGLLAGYVLT